MQLFAFLIKIIVYCSIEDYNSKLPKFLINCKTYMTFHEQHSVNLTIYKLYECSTFKQMLEFPDVGLIYKLQIIQFDL